MGGKMIRSVDLARAEFDLFDLMVNSAVYNLRRRLILLEMA
jgi:hypothetical protein